ncbi:hypothetical protein FQN57_003571 [Myotisia sp. PD_48]|nr:hypothetical protein FQN57_003571 [Myotisia sp. PD_48]
MSEFVPLNKVDEMETNESINSEGAEGAEGAEGPEVQGDKESNGTKQEATNGKKGAKAKAGSASPTTPRKRGRKPAASKEVKKEEDPEGDEGAEESTPTKKRRGRKPAASKDTKDAPAKVKNEESDGNREVVTPKKKAAAKEGKGRKTLPTSYDKASEADKMLLRMKDEQDRPWAEIRKAWEEKTGEPVGVSTLPCRYLRLKANFTVFTDEERELLHRFKTEIEIKFEAEKWTRIAEQMESDSGKKFSPVALQKQFKELTKFPTKPKTATIKEVNGNDEEDIKSEEA